MEEMLKQILTELQNVKDNIKELESKMDKKFAEQYKKISAELEDKMDNKFDEQSKEIGKELREIIDYICNRFDKKTNTINQNLNKEIKSNKIAHDSYNSKMYKIELSQSNLESKVYDLENQEKVANNV